MDGELVHGYEYGAMNRLSKAWNDKGQESVYLYNGLGQRTGKSVNGEEEDYLLDLTRGYHNLLGIQKGESGQRFYFDGNVAAMEETTGKTAGGRERDASGREALSGLHYYLQDELGSPLRVSGYGEGADIPGYLTYGYDEFGNGLGNDLGRELEEEGIPNPYDRQGEEQPFGYTGYRYDGISGTYFAQAREYQTGNGRFTAEDVIKGNNVALATLNQYSYCWNNPVIFADHDGHYPIYTTIGEGVGNTITNLGEAVGNAVGEIGTAIGNAAEEIYSTVGTTVQDICGTVGDVTQEMGAIIGNSPAARLSGALVNHAGNYVGNEIKTFGVEAGNFIKATGMYAENDIKYTTSVYGAAAKNIIKDENVSGTFSRGFDISGSLGPFMVDGSIVLSTDLKGNMTIQKSFAWGITAAAKPGFSASVSIVKTITNAPDVNALLGEGGAVGGSLGGLIGPVPVCAGADFVTVGELDNKLYENYYGYSTSVGIGVPGVEGHAKMSGTGPVTETFNIFDFLFGSDSKECECVE